MYKLLLKLKLFIFIFTILTSCTSEDDYSQNTIGSSGEAGVEYASDSMHDADNESNSVDEHFRKGLVTIDVKITQSREFSIDRSLGPNDPTHTEFKSAYELEASFTRPALVTKDLSDPYIIDYPDDEKSAAYDDGPFYFGEYEDTPPPQAKVDGTINYSLEFNHSRPNAGDVTLHKHSSKGIGRVINIELDHMRLSKTGFGYEFELNIEPDLSVDVKNELISRKMKPQISEEKELHTDILQFNVYPAPSIAAVEKYPFSELEIGAGLKEFELEKVRRHQKVAAEDVTIITEICLGAKESASKTKLSISCEYHGEKYIPMVPAFAAIEQLPETHIVITLTVEALE